MCYPPTPGRRRYCRPVLRRLARGLLFTSGTFAGVVYASGAGIGPATGLNVGPFNIGGYSNLVAELPANGPDALELDGLSLLVSGHVNRCANPFLEAEIDNATIISQQPAQSAGVMRIERLYNDFLIAPHLTLRAGKMLTPVGEWNLIHAAPLVWTVNRPLSTYYSFPQYLTGASFNVRSAGAAFLDVEAYAQPGYDGFSDSNDLQPRQYGDVAGLNAVYSSPLRGRIGVSVQSARVRYSGADQLLASVYGGFASGPVRWQFQAEVTRIDGGTDARAHNREGGGYLQAVYPVTDRWFLVGQAEAFQAREYAASARKWLTGVVYRPRVATAWKLEYMSAQGSPIGTSTGLYAAWAVLF